MFLFKPVTNCVVFKAIQSSTVYNQSFSRKSIASKIMGEKKSNKKNDMKAKKPDESRRNFLKYAGVGAAGIAVGAIVEYPFLNGEVQSANSQLQTANSQLQTANQKISTLNSQLQTDTSQISSLQAQVAESSAFISLNLKEQSLLESIVESHRPHGRKWAGGKRGRGHLLHRQTARD